MKLIRTGCPNGFPGASAGTLTGRVHLAFQATDRATVDAFHKGAVAAGGKDNITVLLVRVAETTTGATWHQLCEHLDELHIGTFTGTAGTYRQRTELTKPQRDIFTRLGLAAPKKIIELAPTPD